MSHPKRFAKGLMAAAAAATVLTGFLAMPTIASAQDGPPPPPPGGTYYDQCQRSTTNREVGGAILGGIAGAVLGNNIGQGPGRAGGSIIGGVAGAAVGANVGKASAACDPNGPPPGPGVAPAGYYDNPPPPPPPRYPPCGRAETRITYPDGSTEAYPTRACRDPQTGVWHVAQ